MVVLDEVDQLEEKDVLYDLNRTRGLSLVLVANSAEELFAELGERVASRFKTATQIHFDRYGTDQLVGILKDRVRWGLHEGAVTDDQLRWIAEAAGGDARVAIGTLRVVARTADRRGLDRLTDEVIEAAAPKAKSEIRRKNLEKLTDDKRVIYDIIEDEGEVAPDALYEAYREEVVEPKSRFTRGTCSVFRSDTHRFSRTTRRTPRYCPRFRHGSAGFRSRFRTRSGATGDSRKGCSKRRWNASTRACTSSRVALQRRRMGSR